MRSGLRHAGLGLLAVLVMGAVIVACGDDDDDGDSVAEPTATAGASFTAQAGMVAPDAKPSELTTAQLQLNWFPEAEFGGFYTALARGFYEEWNVDMDIVPGGPGVNSIAVVGSGQAKFGIANGDQFVMGRNEGVPVVALLAAFQTFPQVIMVHEESGITTLQQIGEEGVPVAVSPNQAYVFYLLETQGWSEDQLRTYNGELGAWLNDKSSATQAFLTSEPYYAREAGAQPRTLSIAEQAGFNPYARILFTTEETIENEPELVNAVVAASLEGWRAYMEDPAPAHEAIRQVAPDETEEGMLYSWQIQKDELVTTGDAAELGIGVMTAERWTALFDQLKQVGLIDESQDPADAWTDEFFRNHIEPPP